jgi:hypothetical protein
MARDLSGYIIVNVETPRIVPLNRLQMTVLITLSLPNAQIATANR